MELVLDQDGHAVLQDGKPVYRHSDGKEIPFDAVATVSKISSLNAEAKKHREAKESAEAALKAFEGLDDPDAARKALDTIKNIDAKKLVDAGQVEAIKAEAKRAYEEQLKKLLEPVQRERDEFREMLVSEKIGGSFARSKYIADKLVLPADLAQKAFGSSFKFEDGAIVAYDNNGKQIYSRARPGEIAGFDEALEQIVDAYPLKDHILKGTGANGGGAQGGMRGGKRTFSRAELDEWSVSDPLKAANMMRDVREGKAELVDN